MSAPSQLYRPSLALLTDFYELTMAFAAWKSGAARKEAAFTLSFRRNPFAAASRGGRAGGRDRPGLAPPVRGGRPRVPPGASGARTASPSSSEGFLEALAALELEVDVDAVPEGTVVFPHEPLLRVRGPVVTGHAARDGAAHGGELPDAHRHQGGPGLSGRGGRAGAGVRAAAGAGDRRRALGQPGGLRGRVCRHLQHAGRQALEHPGEGNARPSLGDDLRRRAGGVHGLRARAPRQLRVPGGHLRHRWTASGTPSRQAAGCAGRGKELVGIRLDSGDLAWLSVEARRMLDEAGLPDRRPSSPPTSSTRTSSAASRTRGRASRSGGWGRGSSPARRTARWGACTSSAPCATAPARPGCGRVKLSEQAAKVNIPGILQVRRWRTHPARPWPT